MNKTASSIRSWEKGDSYPSEQEIDLLAEVLDLETTSLTILLPDSEVWAADPVLPVDVNDPWSEDAPEAADADDVPATGDELDEPEAIADHQEVADAATGELDDPAEADEGGDRSQRGEDDHDDDAGGAGSDSDSSTEGDSSMHEALTEAVPVVPTTAVAVAEPAADSPLATARPQPFGGTANPVLAAWDQILDWYRQVFDPRRKWIYRVRYVLLAIAFFIMLRVLAWAGSNLLDAIGEVLDSFSFSPSETPDVQN